MRDARAADPLITISGLEAVLQKRFSRGISRRYISKLVLAAGDMDGHFGRWVRGGMSPVKMIAQIIPEP